MFQFAGRLENDTAGCQGTTFTFVLFQVQDKLLVGVQSGIKYMLVLWCQTW